jgi:hypothetical protein
MSDASDAVQVALYSTLNAAFGALSPSVPVYDHVPQDEVLPCVVIGDATVLNDDVKTQFGQEHQLEIQVYSAYRGTKEVKQLMSTVYDALHGVTLSVSGFNASYASCQFSDAFAEPEGARGVIRF